MNSKNLITPLVLLLVSVCGSINGQTKEGSLNSITRAEMRDHIFFLASDYMAGRVGPSAEYEIAAQYVGTQFSSAGLIPVVEQEDGTKTYFQDVPFAKTTYGDNFSWSITRNGKTTELTHKEDFKILFANSVNYENTGMVFIGFGIEEPDHDWNDFKDLDVEGKIMICMGGAPEKKGKPVLPQEVHEKYSGMRGFQSKIGGLFSKGAAGIILVDIDGSTGVPFESLPNRFNTEKYVYKGDSKSGKSESIPSIYLVKPKLLEAILEDEKYNPVKTPDNLLKKYKTFVIEDTYLNSTIEILSEELIATKNIIGMVAGTDPDLKNEFIVVGAHLDHVKPVMGQVCNGADDNASGTSGVIEIAEAVAASPCRRPVLFIAYTAEEMGLLGSRYFVNSEVVPKDQIMFNLNMDMIGRSTGENEKTRAHYVVTHKKYVKELELFINDVNDGITDFPLIIENDEDSPGGSDHQSYISEGIPAFFFFSGIHADLHQPGDDPEKIDYAKVESIARLAYLITDKLANMDKVPAFLEE